MVWAGPGRLSRFGILIGLCSICANECMGTTRFLDICAGKFLGIISNWMRVLLPIRTLEHTSLAMRNLVFTVQRPKLTMAYACPSVSITSLLAMVRTPWYLPTFSFNLLAICALATQQVAPVSGHESTSVYSWTLLSDFIPTVRLSNLLTGVHPRTEDMLCLSGAVNAALMCWSSWSLIGRSS